MPASKFARILAKLMLGSCAIFWPYISLQTKVKAKPHMDRHLKTMIYVMNFNFVYTPSRGCWRCWKWSKYANSQKDFIWWWWFRAAYWTTNYPRYGGGNRQFVLPKIIHSILMFTAWDLIAWQNQIVTWPTSIYVKRLHSINLEVIYMVFLIHKSYYGLLILFLGNNNSK